MNVLKCQHGEFLRRSPLLLGCRSHPVFYGGHFTRSDTRQTGGTGEQICKFYVLICYLVNIPTNQPTVKKVLTIFFVFWEYNLQDKCIIS